MRRRICIWWSTDNIDWDCLLSEIQLEDELCVFNFKEFHLLAASHSWEKRTLNLYVYNPEFPVVQEGEKCPHYNYKEAKIKFPYLFSEETNPILYRKFSKDTKNENSNISI